MLLRVLTAARCELVAFLKPFLRQPRKDKLKPRSIPCLRVAEYFRVVDRLRDVFLRIRHHRFSTHFLSINAQHATCFVEHLAGCLEESPNLLSGCLAHEWLSRVGALDPRALLPEGHPLPSCVSFIIRSPRRRAQQRLGSLRRVPSREIYGTRTAAADSCQAPNTSLVPVYDRITFFGNSALRIS